MAFTCENCGLTLSVDVSQCPICGPIQEESNEEETTE